jgi:hypothetical protein
MQVKCMKCSQPIALTDVIEPNNGHLSHVDCKRPQALTPEERALVFVYCSGHVVARCPACDISLRLTELAADMVGGNRMNICPHRRRSNTSLPLCDAARGSTTQGAGGKGRRAAPRERESATHRQSGRPDPRS